MMDLDHFKEVNDTYGHLAGSETLEEMGTVIKSSLRAGDVGARFGGEEFAAFLLDADYAQGMVAAERVRAAIEEHEFPAVRRGSTEEPRTHRMTISIGVASFPNDASDPIQLVEKADSALYRAKRSGRNRVCAYTAGQQGPQEISPPAKLNREYSSYTISDCDANLLNCTFAVRDHSGAGRLPNVGSAGCEVPTGSPTASPSQFNA